MEEQLLPSLTPLYMYAGGKTKLLKRYNAIWPNRGNYHTYVEPFFGGGAVYCDTLNRRPGMHTIINDINYELMEMLTLIQKDAEMFIITVERMTETYLTIEGKKARKEWYYGLREGYWTTPTPPVLYMLMRLGFNGIWQTCKASKGLFGTPAGLMNQTNPGQIINTQLVQAWNVALQTTTVHSGSYDKLTIPNKKPALIYLDPPYRDSFTSYGTGFNDEDQTKLAHWYRNQVEVGHTVILANRAVPGDPFFEKLLNDIADFHYFDVTYTAGRRKKTSEGYEAKPAQEFVAISKQ